MPLGFAAGGYFCVAPLFDAKWRGGFFVYSELISRWQWLLLFDYSILAELCRFCGSLFTCSGVWASGFNAFIIDTPLQVALVVIIVCFVIFITA